MAVISQFAIALLTSGIVYGIFAVLILRALRVDEKRIEERLNDFRCRLGNNSFGVIEAATIVILSLLSLLYGRTAGSRLVRSALIGALVTSLILLYLRNEYVHLPAAIRAKAVEVEREADEYLFDVKHDPAKEVLWHKAFAMHWVYKGHDNDGEEYLNFDDDSLRIRAGVDHFDLNLQKAIAKQPERSQLALLYFFEGSYLDQGFQLTALCFLFLYNLLADFLLASVAWHVFKRLAAHPRLVAMVGVGCLLLLLTGVGYCTSLVSYRMFFMGNTGVFSQLIFVLPMACAFAIGGGVSLVLGLVPSVRRVDNESRLPLCVGGGVGLAIGLWGVSYLVGRWSAVSDAFVAINEASPSLYVLAATVWIPFLLCVVGLIVSIVLKTVAEPARLVTWAYMTYVKVHQGGSLLSGIITFMCHYGRYIRRLHDEVEQTPKVWRWQVVYLRR